MIYLDNAATTLKKPPEVALAMRNALETCGGAGRGGHAAANRAAEILYDCREEAARLFNMSNPERVILTSNATHGLNMVIKSFARPGRRVLISGFEHNAVYRPLVALRNTGVRVDILPTPLFEPDEAVWMFENAVKNDVCLVACIHVSNVFGYILPIERIAKICAWRGIPMLVDASQSAGLIPVEGDSYPVWCMPGHKSLYGPQGTGLVLVPPGMDLEPLIYGGTGGNSRDKDMPPFLPDRLEAGTHNAPGAAGLAAGIRYVSRLGKVRDGKDGLLADAAKALSAIKGVHVYYDSRFQTGALSFTVDGKDSESVSEYLAKQDIAVRGGLHCAPLAHITAGTDAQGTVRCSFSNFNTQRDVAALVRAMQRL